MVSEFDQYFLPPSAVYSFHGWLASARYTSISYRSPAHDRGEDGLSYLRRTHQLDRLRPLSRLRNSVVVVGSTFRISRLLPKARRPNNPTGPVHDDLSGLDRLIDGLRVEVGVTDTPAPANLLRKVPPAR